MEDDFGEITLLLQRMNAGEDGASQRLFALLYTELHRQAERCMRAQPPGHTLQATALVNEAFLRVAGNRVTGWENRKHFLCTAARAMRSVLVDHARKKRRRKRGDGAGRVPLDSITLAFEERSTDLVDLDAALQRLEERDARAAQVVTLRFFGGRTMPQIAELLAVSVSTIERDWDISRAWLRRELA